MRVTIATVSEAYFDGEAVSVTVPGASGIMTVLARHEPIITTLKEGTIVVRELADTEPRQFPITSGVLEVNKDGVTILL